MALFIVVLLMSTSPIVHTHRHFVAIDHITEYMEDVLRLPRVSIIFKSLRSLSPTYSLIINDILEKFPAVTVETPCVTDFHSQLSERGVFRITFIEGDNLDDIVRELNEFIDFLTEFVVASQRPKCLIFVVTDDERTDFSLFFTHSWANKFLDVTIVQLNHPNRSNRLILPPIFNLSSALIHQYNPFNDTLTKSRLVRGSDLFEDKLQQLYGSTLKVGFIEYYPEVVIDKNATIPVTLDSLFGHEVELTRLFADFLNFTVGIERILNYDSNSSALNLTACMEYEAFRDDLIDFSINPFIYWRPLTTQERADRETSDYFFIDGFYIIFKCRVRKELNPSFKVVMVLSIAAFMVLCYSSILGWLRFDNDIWTKFNVIKILLGQALRATPRGLVHRIEFVTLSLMYYGFTAAILENLLNVFLILDTFPGIGTLREMLDSGLIPSIRNYTKDSLYEDNFTDSLNLLELSKTIESADVWQDCLTPLIEDYGDVQGCELTRMMANLLVDVYSRGDKGWVLSKVKEPVISGWSAYAFSTDLYVERYNEMFHRLLQAGLLPIIHKETAKKLLPETYDFEESTNVEDGSDYLDNLRQRFIYFLTFGYLLAFCCFVLEILYDRSGAIIDRLRCRK